MAHQKQRKNAVVLATVSSRVQEMSGWKSEAKKLAKKNGMDIVNVSWEDCARNKNSVWGPCISDMTLQVSDKRMPVMRFPNYTDLTWDVRIEKIPLIVGNERKEKKAIVNT